MAIRSSTMAVVLTAALLVLTTERLVEGQSSDCIAKLVDCGEYLNTTTRPAAGCCDAIESVVTTQLDCLCKIYNQPGGLSALGINITQALLLPKRCELSNDVSACNATAPGSSVPPPPGSPDNSVGRSSWFGLPALFLEMATRAWTMAVVLTAALLVLTTGRLVEGQASDCIGKLAQCAEYLNSTTRPAARCCNAIKSVVTTEVACLCKIYNQPGGLSALGINVTQALLLPNRCKLPYDIVSICNATVSSPSPSPSPGPSLPLTPPGSPDNGVSRISWIGIPALFLVSAATFLY